MSNQLERMPRSVIGYEKWHNPDKRSKIGFMEVKEIGIKTIFDTVKIQLRLELKHQIIIWDVREFNRTLERLRFFIKVNS